MKQLDFTKNTVETLGLDDLRQTFKENYPNGLPVGGIYHFDLIQRLLDIIQAHNIKPVVQEIFAANNREKYRPGVSVSDVVAAEKGINSLEAHILRRVYANINLEMDILDDVKLNCAVAYHQKGIQIAFGPYVHVCHNQTILSAKDMFTTQKISQAKGLEFVERDVMAMLGSVSDYLDTFEERQREMAETVKKWKATYFMPVDFRVVLSSLVLSRVAHDSHDPDIHRVMEYPLNNAQINAACERYLKLEFEKSQLRTYDPTYWEVFNAFNYDLKPGRAEIPTIVGQSIGLFNAFKEAMEYITTTNFTN